VLVLSRPEGRDVDDRALARRLIVLVVVLLAFAARLVPVLRGGGLDGVYGYDDGVYYTGAAALVAGRLPYADFLLLHPPGILLVLSPFAALGRVTSDHTGLAVARLAFMALGALNAGMVAALAARPGRSRRWSLAAAATGGVFYALWYSSIFATRTTLLEGLGTTCLLLALTLVWRRDVGRWAWFGAGAALGFGACTKIWGVVPLVVVALWVWRRHGRGPAGRVAVGAGATAVVVCGPFLAAAPAPMLRLVVRDQLRRPLTTPSPVVRALDASSLDWNLPSLSGTSASVVLVVIGVVVVAACVVAWRSGAVLPVLLLAATFGTLAAGPSYYTHYGEFLAAPLALVLAAVAGAWSAHDSRPGLLRPSFVIPVMVLLVLELPTQRQPLGQAVDRVGLQRAVASARCVATEAPSMLAITDSLSRGLDAGCAVPVDVTGVLYDVYLQQTVNGRRVTRLGDKRYQRYLATYFFAADAQLFVLPERSVLNAAGRRRLHEGRLVASDGTITVYRRP
jgi:hypothetical protein